MNKPSSLLIPALALLFSPVLTGCGSEDQQTTANEPIAVRTITVGNAATQSDYNYSGTVEEDNATPLSFTLGGTITSLRVKVGDRVQKGQLIATVNPTSARNSHDIALATLRQAEDAYARLKQLHDRGSLPDIKWVEAESQLAQARSAELLAKKNLDDCSLYAPTSGIVSDKLAEVGQNAAPGVPVVKIVTTRVMNVRLSVPETEIARVSVGQRADILVSALDGRHFTGRVVEKGIVADPISRSYAVKVRLDGTDASVLPGMVTSVALAAPKATASTPAAAITIPARLLQLADDNSSFVWVDEGGKAVKRTVVCGDFTANGVVILSGLAEGDRVITEGQQKVCQGARVKALS